MKLRLWPNSLAGQLVLAVALMLFAAQGINFVLLSRGLKQQALAHGGGMAVARIIDGKERAQRGDFARPSDGRPGYERSQRLAISNEPPLPPTGAVRLPDMAEAVRDLLGEASIRAESVDAWSRAPRERLRRPAFPDRGAVVVAKLDGRYFMVRTRIARDSHQLSGFLVWQTLSLYLLLLIPIIVIAWRAASPLRILAGAARASPALRDLEPLKEEGPSDVRDLIAAFNAYRMRISTMLSDKDRMLGAVGHDLRTPLASLRVRVEQVDDDNLRNKMVATIDEMAAILTDILALARSGVGTELQEHVNLHEIVNELARDYRERGKDVTIGKAADVTALVRPMLMRRALRNLVDNALAYGVRARLSVLVDKSEAQIVVSDDGPGLTDEQISTLVEVFARGEQSRNRATGGVGLGLSIAREIAEGEGGTLTLANGEFTGLDAKITLRRVV